MAIGNYQSDTLAFTPPPGPIRSAFDPRMRDIAYNRVPLKQGWDTLAIGRQLLRGDLTMQQRKQCIDFYLNTGTIRNLLATLTRCGSHWTILGLTLAQEIRHGRRPDYSFINHYWQVDEIGVRYTKLDWREAVGETRDPALWKTVMTDPFLYHSHHPYYRIRSARLKEMNTVLVLRDIFKSMESKFYKLSKIPDQPDDEDDASFAWEKLILDAIEFFNSWGDVIRWHRKCVCFTYDELLADTVGCHYEMSKVFGLDVPRECIEEAFSMITKSEMRKRFTDPQAGGEMRVSGRAKDAGIPAHRRELIEDMIDRHLVYDFGFGYGNIK